MNFRAAAWMIEKARLANIKRRFETKIVFELWRPMTLREAQVRHVQRMIRHYDGNKTRTARELGIDRRSLFKIIKE